MNNDFNSQNSRNVINVGANHGTINVDDKKPQDYKQSSGNHLIIFAILISFLVFAVVVISISISKPSTTILNQSANPTTNTQPNELLQNTNVNTINSNQIVTQSNIDKPKSGSKVAATPVKTARTRKTKPKTNTTLPDCALTSNGC